MMILDGSVSEVEEIVCAFGGLELVEQGGYAFSGGFEGTLGSVEAGASARRGLARSAKQARGSAKRRSVEWRAEV